MFESLIEFVKEPKNIRNTLFLIMIVFYVVTGIINFFAEDEGFEESDEEK